MSSSDCARPTDFLVQVLAGCLLVCIAAPASAVSSGFAAEITVVWDDTLGSGLGIGDLIRGDFASGGCAAGDAPCFDFYGIDPVVGGLYLDFNFATSFVLGGFEVETDGISQADTLVLNRAPAEGGDEFAVTGVGQHAMVTPPDDLVQEWIVLFSLSLSDLDGTVFDDGGVPAELPPLNRFEDTSFHISLFGSYGDDWDGVTPQPRFEASGIIVALPEPSAGVLVGLGLAGLAGRRMALRRKVRDSRSEPATHSRCGIC